MAMLIWLSHGLNLLFLGSPYEMFCARAWRLRSHAVWFIVQQVIDRWTPLALWRTETMTHCQWCFDEEQKRVKL